METDGPYGKLAVFEVKYTFGIGSLTILDDRFARQFPKSPSRWNRSWK